MTQKTYHQFTTEEFLLDADFIRYVKFKDPEDVVFWENWALENTTSKSVFEDARLELEVILSAKAIPVPTGFMKNLQADINRSIDQIQQKKRKVLALWAWSSSIAASLALVFAGAWYFNSTVTIRTEFGQVKELVLADGTEVTLNANSTLSYPRAYKWKKVRSIVLDGEAYFKVKHLNQNPKQIKNGELFQAETGSVEVQVLGTEFNLKERHGVAHIALINGKVQVKSIKTGAQYIMTPGNVLKVNASNGELIHDEQDPAMISAWTDGKLIVNQTSVNEIIAAFEDLYGYKVILDNPALGQKKIDGSISIKSEQSLLFTLSNILNVNIKKEGKIIRLETRR
ncbi:FecR family protein [Pedobacter sp. MW01-1-1]|uniref:FecR family protein n=1 Tax=Pedobacter sp. MW01-1-1 TaxID=3383027 RepID=UPI003FEE45FE